MNDDEICATMSEKEMALLISNDKIIRQMRRQIQQNNKMKNKNCVRFCFRNCEIFCFRIKTLINLKNIKNTNQ